MLPTPAQSAWGPPGYTAPAPMLHTPAQSTWGPPGHTAPAQLGAFPPPPAHHARDAPSAAAPSGVSLAPSVLGSGPGSSQHSRRVRERAWEYAQAAFFPEEGEDSREGERRFQRLVAQYIPLAVSELREEGKKGTGVTEASNGGRSITWEDLEGGTVSARGAKDIKSSVTPLSVGYAVPGRQDLTPFWKEAEAALPGLCRGLNVSLMRWVHMCAIGPHLLGRAVWERVVDEPFETWEEFKAVVQAGFGLTLAEIRRGFNNLTKGPRETDESFIARVESERKNANLSKDLCYDNFIK